MIPAELESMLGLAERQVSGAEELHASGVGAYLSSSSGRKHQTFYVADAQGLIRLRQDSVFVADTIFWRGGAGPGGGQDVRVSIELGQGRIMTHGTGADIGSTVPSRDDRAFIDHNALIPTRPALGVSTVLAYYSWGTVADEAFVLPSELVLPRGEVVRVRASPTGVTWRFILSGYIVLAR